MQRTSFVFNLAWCEMLEGYPAEVRHEVYDAIIGYARTGKLPELKPLAAMAFAFIKREIDENFARCDAIIEARRKGGRRGMANRWHNKNNSVISVITDDNKNNSVITGDNINNKLSNTDLEDKKEIEIKENYPKEKEKEKRTTFVKPTIEQVKERMQEMGYTGFSAEAFWNFYESKGWMVGSNPMKNWKAALVTWNSQRRRTSNSRTSIDERIHYPGEYDPHAFDEDAEWAKQQKERQQ